MTAEPRGRVSSAQCNIILRYYSLEMNLIFISVLAGCASLLNGQTICHTPDNQEGECKAISNCQYLLDLVNKNRTKQETVFLKKSHCGYIENLPAVCCQKKPELAGTGNCQNTITAYPLDPQTRCCGIDLVDRKILGGSATQLDSYPWLVLIEYVKQNVTKLLCGGALISNKYVLTAGHCVAGPVLNFGTPRKVRLGEYDISHEGIDCMAVEAGGEDCTEGVTRIDIDKIVPHPEYKPVHNNMKNDIALIRLQEKAPFTDFIRPICLPTKDVTLPENIPSNWTLVASGWGAVKTKQYNNNVKQYEYLSFVAQDKCQAFYGLPGRNITLAKGQLCAAGNRDSCKGDAGGPLMYEEGPPPVVIVGVFSFGSVSCRSGDIPDVYTNVYEYINWIKSNIVP